FCVSSGEPGFFNTNIGRNRQYGADPINDCDPWVRRGLSSIERLEIQGPGPEAVAECVLRIVETRSPALRYRVGRDARRYIRLRRILPASTFERGVRRAFKLDAKS